MKTNLLVLTLAIALICLAGICLAGNFSIAQDYTFKVLLLKGKNEVKSGGNWLPLKPGSTLKSYDEVKVVDNAYLALVHVSGTPLQIKEAGQYKVSDLATKVIGSSTVLNKYTEFILSTTAGSNNRLAATGAVHRGGPALDVYLPKPEVSLVYGNKVTLAWEANTPPYIVAFKSIFGDDLRQLETNDTTVTFNLNDPDFAHEDNILVEVYPKGKPQLKLDPAKTIKKLSLADKERIKPALDEFMALLSENTALNKLYLAGFLEEKKLLIDAGTAYLEAIALEPDVQAYKDAYVAYLYRHGMIEK